MHFCILPPLREGSRLKTLSQLLNDQTIRLNITASTWEEAVRTGVGLLVKSGSVSTEYVDASVNLIHELGPYMVIAPGLALAHARPESGVFENCLSLITLATPVEFGNPDNDPVDILISLGAIDNQEHVDMIANLAEFISSLEGLDVIRNSGNVADVTMLVSRYEDRASLKGG